jgi:hypothetical protein
MAGDPEVIRASSRFVSTNALPCTGLRARLPAPLVELPNLRRRFPFLVRLVHRYYGTVRQTITVPLLHIGAFIGANPEVARLLLFDLTNLDLLTRRGYRCRLMIARLVNLSNLSRHNKRRLAKKISYFQTNSMLVFARPDHQLNPTPRLSMQLSRQILLVHFDGT